MQSEKRKSQKSGEKEREKVGKLRNTVFFQCVVAPEARKVGSLKRRVRRHLVRWEMKNCTPLWREAHFEVKRITKNTTGFGPLLDVEMSKKRTLSRHEAYFEVKFQDTMFGARLEAQTSKNCTPLWCEARWKVLTVSDHFWHCDFFVQFFVLFWWFLRAIFRALFVISPCNLSCFLWYCALCICLVILVLENPRL